MRTGAGTTTSVAFDSRGLPIRQIRPNDRGETRYAFDLDGRLLRQVVTAGNGEEWETAYHYDATGRVTQIDHEDGTSESSTYNADNTVATRTGRDGVTVTFSYDTANRLLSAVPSSSALPGSLVALDAGDFFDYDELSRVTEVRRGSAGGSGVDSSLTVAFSDYDLASRPGSEIVGGREPLGRQYDSWDRPIAVTLPAGVGRGTAGSFTGFERQYDSLDRVSDVGGLGQLTNAPLGVTWSWGGVGRIYGRDSKAPLGTAVRYGYIGGRGAQPPGTEPGAPESRWRLGTVTWGSTVDSVAGVTEPPATVWGQFAFGWRGNDGDPRDGVKQGRIAVAGLAGGLDLFAGMGWSWNYDAGVRLSYA
ncbi:MAG: hypothetical protein GY856_42110, partial [bacterium]|nr:hypothetical protein [bacterium]